MQIDMLDSGCLTLLLSDEELSTLGLCFEELDGRSPRTRHMVQTLLQMVRQEYGYAPAGAVLVEAVPLEGGCLLLITPHGARPAARAVPAVFRVAGENALLQIAAAWNFAAGRPGEQSSLYRADGKEGGFYLVLHVCGGSPLPPVLYECAEPLGEGALAAACAAEHGRPVFIGDALPRLRRLVQG